MVYIKLPRVLFCLSSLCSKLYVLLACLLFVFGAVVSRERTQRRVEREVDQRALCLANPARRRPPSTPQRLPTRLSSLLLASHHVDLRATLPVFLEVTPAEVRRKQSKRV